MYFSVRLGLCILNLRQTIHSLETYQHIFVTVWHFQWTSAFHKPLCISHFGKLLQCWTSAFFHQSWFSSMLLLLLSELFPPGVCDHTFLIILLSLHESYISPYGNFFSRTFQGSWSTSQVNATIKNAISGKSKIIFTYLFNSSIHLYVL